MSSAPQHDFFAPTPPPGPPVGAIPPFTGHAFCGAPATHAVTGPAAWAGAPSQPLPREELPLWAFVSRCVPVFMVVLGFLAAGRDSGLHEQPSDLTQQPVSFGHGM